MTNESSPNDTRCVWQSQKSEGIRMSAEEIRRKAEKFQRKVFWENALSYGIGLAGVAYMSFRLFGYRFPTNLNLPIRLGGGLLLGGLLYALWQIHRRSPSRRVPAEAGLANCLEFHRRELERRRDFHRSVWKWCFVPSLPGVVVLLLVGLAGMRRNHVPHGGWILAGVVTVVGLFYILGWKQSADRARQLQGEIDELDALQR